jgi:hypothetical protein
MRAFEGAGIATGRKRIMLRHCRHVAAPAAIIKCEA